MERGTPTLIGRDKTMDTILAVMSRVHYTMVSGSIGGGGGCELLGEGRVPNRPATEKKAVRERMTPPQMLVV